MTIGFLRSTLFGPKGKENTCNGDSGSPLMVNLGGQFVQVFISMQTFSEKAR